MAGYIGSKASVVSSGAEHKKLFNITTTTTSLTGLVYTPTLVHVFHNGVRLVDGTDYTATNGTSITLTVAAQNGDQVAVVSYATFQTSDTVSASAGGTFGNSVTMNSGAVVNRTGDGTIVNLQAGGISVGSIGAFGGDAYFGTGDTGLIAYDNGNAILPFNTATGAYADNSLDFGVATQRFKDAYLSGGVYLGGTGAANKLDDYEEGLWYPSYISWNVNPTISGTAKYTKIGRIVNVSVYLIGGTTVAGCSIEGLPFTVGTEASCLGTNGSTSTLALTGTLYGGTTRIAAISGSTALTGTYYAVTATYTI